MNEKQKEALLAKLDARGITLILVNLKEKAYEDILRTTTLSTAKVILVAEDTDVLDDKSRSAITNKVAIVSSDDKFNVSYIINSEAIPELIADKEVTTKYLLNNNLINTHGSNHMYIFVNEHDTVTLSYLEELIK